LIFVGLGALLAAFISRQDITARRKLAYPMLFFCYALLLLVLVPGVGIERNGAQRWLGAAGFAFEPSELMKPVFVLYLAHSITRKQAKMASFTYGVLPHLVMAGLVMLLLMLEPDFGATVLTAMATLGMLFVGGARLHHLASLGVLSLLGAIALVLHAPYRLARILHYLHPWENARDGGYQLVQSLIAFGTGGFFGVGPGNGHQKLFYLPEGHTDFIFSLIGEELGFIGAMVVIGCFAIIGTRGFRVGTRSRDPFVGLLAFGLTFLLVGQAAINLGVVLGLLPTKGLALPFVSYGGSAMLANGLLAGSLLSLSRETR
jgi:cell division protein FtsW